MKRWYVPRRWLCLAAPLPALLVGVLVMRRTGVPASVWGQNLAAGLVLTTICAFATAADRRPAPFWRGVFIYGALGLLLATFRDAGLEGVHRWVQAGPLRIHAGAICLPALILALGARMRARDTGQPEWSTLLPGSMALALLALQPDAAQATAFAGALLALLACGRRRLLVLALAVPFAVAVAAWAWKRPDPLLPVIHVEGIVGLAVTLGPPWKFVAPAALALLPLPFLFAKRGDKDFPTALALGIYFLLCLLAPIFGSFPVPVMGFGLSPIIGYYLALGWLAARGSRGGS